MNSKQQKIDTIRGLIEGRITLNQIEDRREVFFTDGVPSRYTINGKEVDFQTFDEIIRRGPKNPSQTIGLGDITYHDAISDIGRMPDEGYWPPL